MKKICFHCERWEGKKVANKIQGQLGFKCNIPAVKVIGVPLKQKVKRVEVTLMGLSISPAQRDCRGIRKGLHVGFRLFFTTYRQQERHKSTKLQPHLWLETSLGVKL